MTPLKKLITRLYIRKDATSPYKYTRLRFAAIVDAPLLIHARLLIHASLHAHFAWGGVFICLIFAVYLLDIYKSLKFTKHRYLQSHFT